MIYQNWAPAEIIDYLNELSEYRGGGALSEDEALLAKRFHEMWTRLVTRPEMEFVWRFIVERAGDTFSLRTNGGLLARVNGVTRDFEENPKFSPKAYEEEMHEIAKLADTLARKLRKFSNAGSPYNPFPLHSLLDSAQVERARHMMHPDILARRRELAPFSLTYWLPTIDEQLARLASNAAAEAEHQAHKLKLPRKVNDKNTFRTYFINVVRDYFFCMYADYSPARLATFCSVALDDPDITANLVGKLFPLGDDEKEMLRMNISEPED